MLCCVYLGIRQYLTNLICFEWLFATFQSLYSQFSTHIIAPTYYICKFNCPPKCASSAKTTIVSRITSDHQRPPLIWGALESQEYTSDMPIAQVQWPYLGARVWSGSWHGPRLRRSSSSSRPVYVRRMYMSRLGGAARAGARPVHVTSDDRPL